jgi:hypothetical protein
VAETVEASVLETSEAEETWEEAGTSEEVGESEA